MKNLTLAVDEGLLEKVRSLAAQRGTTVNALVREHFEQLSRNEERRLETLRELREMSSRSSARLGPDFKFSREETYAERTLPRHQHSALRGSGGDR